MEGSLRGACSMILAVFNPIVRGPGVGYAARR
jgi:hypothetical protein